MSPIRTTLACGVILCTTSFALGVFSPDADSSQKSKNLYWADVEPIFKKNCVRCHGGMSKSGRLSLKRYKDFVKGGKNGKLVSKKVHESLLLKRIDGRIKPTMPTDSKDLSSSDIQKIKNWLEQGAKEK